MFTGVISGREQRGACFQQQEFVWFSSSLFNFSVFLLRVFETLCVQYCFMLFCQRFDLAFLVLITLVQHAMASYLHFVSIFPQTVRNKLNASL